MAAKRINIDWKKVDNYLKAQCSGSGIASLLGIHENTLYDHCKQDNGVEFMAYSQQKKSEGKELLRAKQFQTAMEGEKTMLIWLGKQYLEQHDKANIDHTTKGESINKKVDLSKLTDEEIALMAAIEKKLNV